MNWQPIETAPKDKDILLFCPRLGVVRGCWNDCSNDKSPKPYWTNDRADIFGVRYTRNDQPTHWMHLPDAPGRLTQLESRYVELHVAARACLRYDGVDPVRFSEAMRHMDALIQRHIAEINEKEDE